jgi:hypothetical protein
MAMLLGSLILLSAALSDGQGADAPPVVSDSAEAAPEAPEAVLTPYAYLYQTYPRYASRLNCVFARESGWDPQAYNRRSGASGLAQFILSTWLSTPQGKAGAARTDPFASIDASVYLIENTPSSWRHWQVILQGYC